MKKVFCALLCLLLVLSFTGCSCSSEKGAETSAVTNHEGVENPFVPCDDLEKAQKLAGFEFQVPEKSKDYNTRTVEAVKNEMIQVTDTAKDGEENYTMRKAKAKADTPDISGDYNAYSNQSELQIGDVTVTVKGNGFNINVIYWQDKDGEYSYSVTEGDHELTTKELEEIVNGMK